MGANQRMYILVATPEVNILIFFIIAWHCQVTLKFVSIKKFKQIQIQFKKKKENNFNLSLKKYKI